MRVFSASRWSMILLLPLLVLLLAGCEGLVTVVVTATPEPTMDPTESMIRTAIVATSEAGNDIPSPAAAPTPIPRLPKEGGILQKVKQRGYLVCGVNGDLPGFSKLGPNDTMIGFDADFCRVVATAIFGKPDAVEFRPMSADDRFAAVRTGAVDVLFRNTTWTATRDNATERVDFGPTIFHDGQGFLIRNNLNITRIEEFSGRSICVLGSTTNETNLRDEFEVLGIDATIVVRSAVNDVYRSYEDGECDAVTADRSQLAAKRTELTNPRDHMIIDAIISREPLGPVVVENDSEWRDVVSWAIFATMYAEELDVSSVNVEVLRTTLDPNIRPLLGLDGTIGADLGLDQDFAYNIIKHVGNYEEIYDRHLGPTTSINLERGPNKIWNRGQGGMLTSPPFR